MQNNNLKMHNNKNDESDFNNIKKIAYKKYLQHGFLIKNDLIDQDQYQNTDQVKKIRDKNYTS